MKRIFLVIMALMCIMFLTGCKEKVESLEGKWKETGNNETWHEATIKDGIIEIYWISEDMNALYWRGTYEEPDGAVSEYEWTSLNRIPEDQLFMMASSAESKMFYYEDGVLSYEVSAMGVTRKFKLKLVE